MERQRTLAQDQIPAESDFSSQVLAFLPDEVRQRVDIWYKMQDLQLKLREYANEIAAATQAQTSFMGNMGDSDIERATETMRQRMAAASDALSGALNLIKDIDRKVAKLIDHK